MVNKIALTILISIILTIILVSLVNVDTSIFIEEPKYEDYCGYARVQPIEWNATVEKEMEQCYLKFEDALKPYNQMRFYVFAFVGFILLLTGLFVKENMVQITGLATGGILVFEGVVMNFEDKIAVFVSLLAILVVFGIVAWKVIKKVK